MFWQLFAFFIKVMSKLSLTRFLTSALRALINISFLLITTIKHVSDFKETKKNCGYKNYILEKSSNRAKLYLGDQEFVWSIKYLYQFGIIKADTNLFCFSFGSFNFICIDNFGVHDKKEIWTKTWTNIVLD